MAVKCFLICVLSHTTGHSLSFGYGCLAKYMMVSIVCICISGLSIIEYFNCKADSTKLEFSSDVSIARTDDEAVYGCNTNGNHVTNLSNLYWHYDKYLNTEATFSKEVLKRSVDQKKQAAEVICSIQVSFES